MKKKLAKRILGLFLAVVMVFIAWTPVQVKAASEQIEISVGETKTLGSSSLFSRKTWESSDSSVATVNSKGAVTGIAPGTATITATSKSWWGGSSKTTTYEVSVKEAESGTGTKIKIGETTTLSVSSSGTTTWKSSDESVATVSSAGVVTGVGEGTATITATTKSGGFSFWFISWGGKTTTEKFTVEVVADESETPDVPETHTVTFESNGGNAVESQVVEEGQAAVKPEDPTKEGFTFVGWYRDEALENEYDFTTEVNGDITLYAKWEEVEPEVVTYTVTFDSNGGSTVESQVVEEGQAAVKPEDPILEGYSFAGWYSDEQMTDTFDFDTPINNDITLFAKWDLIPVVDPDEPPVVDDLDDLDPDIAIYAFDMDVRSIPVNTNQAVVFTAELHANIELASDDVRVVDSKGNIVGIMHDDGIDGDEESDDEVYTLKVILSNTREEYVNYHVNVKDINSESLTIGYYVPMSDEEISDIEKVDERLTELTASEEFKNASIEERSSLAISCLEQLVAEGLVVEDSIYYDVSTGMCEFEYSCGVFGSIMLKDVDDSINSNAETSKDTTEEKTKKIETETDAQKEVSLFSSDNLSANSVSGEGNYTALVMQGFGSGRQDYYNGLESDWDNMGLATTVDVNVTVADMKRLKGYDVITFSMHGSHTSPGYDRNSNVPVLCLNETVTTNTDSTYSYELNTRRSVKRVTLTTGGQRYWVCPRFFADNYSSTSLKGQMIFSESCCFYGCDCLSTTPDNTLANQFINIGASVVVGYHNSVGATYSRDIMKDVIEASFNGEKVSTALTAARNEHGANDANHTDGWEDIQDHKYKAYPILAGSNDFVLRADGTLSGTVLNAETEAAIAKATVRVYKDGKEIKKTKTSSTGNYKITGLDAGTYILQVTASKYKSLRIEVTIVPGEDTYVETTLLMSIGGIVSGSINGIVSNSVTNEEVDGVTVKVRNNWNNENGTVKSSTNTNENGFYTLDIGAGFYTLEFSKDGFITVYKNVFVGISGTNSFNAVISPESVEGTYRIVLTWGENPRDLDSHVAGQTSTGSSFHVYYEDMEAYDGNSMVCNLDVDDTSSYGPETITLNANSTQTYYYYVHHYSGSGSISSSNAQVKVYRGDTLLKTYNAPTDQGTDIYWNVFAIVNGNLVTGNTITASPNTSYAVTNNSEVVEEESMTEIKDNRDEATTEDVIEESETEEVESSVEADNEDVVEEITTENNDMTTEERGSEGTEQIDTQSSTNEESNITSDTSSEETESAFDDAA